jgi:hypothetical protein
VDLLGEVGDLFGQFLVLGGASRRQGSFRNTGPGESRTVSRRQGVQETASKPSLFRVRLSVAEPDLPSAEPLTP